MSGFEVLGAVAAAGQFVEQGSKIVKLAKSVYGQFQDAPEQVQQRLERLEDFIAIAERIRQTKALQTTETERILNRCQADTVQLRSKLEATKFKSDDPFRKKAKKAISGVMEEDDVLKLFDTLDKELSPLGLHVNGINLETNHNTAELMQTEFSKVKDQLVNITRATDPSSGTEKCLKDLFITDPSIDRVALTTAKGDVLKGTCDWIVQKEAFVEWQASENGRLWISGGPGMGKTMLSIYLTEYLEQGLHRAEDGSPVTTNPLTYFFCDFKDDRRNSAVSILRGLLFQLIQQNELLVDRILPMYKIQQEKLFHQTSFETLWKIFIDMINDGRTGRVSCILDGLDECHTESLEHLLWKLRQAQSTTSRLRVIVVSREHPDCLKDSLGRTEVARIQLDPDAKAEISAGLDQYISTRVAELAEIRQYSVELTKHVEATLRQRSNGTYLWVAFVVKDLRGVYAPDVEAKLNGFPSGLDALYERMLQLIDPNQQKLVKEILRWCTFSLRPLTPNELVSALGIQPTKFLNDEADILQEKLKYCGHFLNSSPEGVTLVHQSAYDFLTSQRRASGVTAWFSLSNIKMEQAKLASECISYLQDFGIDDDLLFEARLTFDSWNPQDVGYRLVLYATRYWPDHFRLSDRHGTDIIRDYPKVFSNKSPVLDRWLVFLTRTRYSNGDTLKSIGGLLGVAARFGLSFLMKQILGEERRHNWRHLKGFRRKPSLSALGRALSHAVEGRHIEVVDILLEFKAPVATKTSLPGLPPLHSAAESGQLLIAKRLLQHQAPVNVEDWRGETPLSLATDRGDLQLVECLLKAGADVNWPKKAAWRPSSVAASAPVPIPEPIQRILKWNPDLNYIYHSRETPLSSAAVKGNVSIMRLLLDPKLSPDVNRRCDEGFTALHYAISGGGLEATEMLLNYPGVDPHLRVDRWEQWSRWGPFRRRAFGPLDLALEKGTLEVLRLFVEKWHLPLPEPSPDTPFGAIHLVLCSPAYPFIFRDPRDVLEKLRFLVNQLNVDPQQRTWGSDYQTPLFLAVRNGYFEAVKYILDECNIDPRARCCGTGATPLHAVAQSDNPLTSAIVDFLVNERGVNVDALDSLHRTPLHYALEDLCRYSLPLDTLKYGHDAVQPLLKAGAQVSLKDSNGCTARDLIVGPYQHEIQKWFDAVVTKHHSSGCKP
ncbi:Fc.00g002150.m01.CDS01 [Cosmosporella sp. VM-42]